MLNIATVPFKPSALLDEVDGLDRDACLKYGILFLAYKDESFLIMPNENTDAALSYLDHFDFDYKFAFLSQKDYDEAYSLALESMNDNSNKEIIQDENMDGEDDENIFDILKNSSDILTSEESAPVISFVNRILYQALRRGSSDVHIEPYRDGSRIRFRIDGVMQNYINIPNHLTNGVTNRIKVISHLDISEKRVPQDGRTQIIVAKKRLDIRVSTLPVHFGERIVMRLLMQTDTILTLEQLGLKPYIVDKLKGALASPNGIILVTGPTGSGKTTTLYSLLNMKKDGFINIMSIEDPIEYNIEGVSQTQVNTKANLTFAAGLRSILRQDPDVILIGEMRDKETAQIAIQSSLTGHLVLSTLHTNDAVSSITRLVDMGIERFLISSSITAILAQRLVRKLCDFCKVKCQIDDFHSKLLNIPIGTQIYTNGTCSKCNGTGFKGRLAVGEIIMVDSHIKSMVQDEKSDNDIREYVLKSQNMITLQSAVSQMVKEGSITVQEAIKVSVS